MLTTFIGVDLAWQGNKNHSGIAVLRGDSNRITLLSCSTGITTIFSVVDYIRTNATANTVVAIDAPLIIKNSDGQRPCENLIGKKFGRYNASAHSSNLTRYPNAGSIQVTQQLEQSGFSHTPDPTTDKHKKGCWFFEVYPHPAMVVLFNLEKIIKYKKGSVADKRKGLEILRRHIKTKLIQGKPILQPNEKFFDYLITDVRPIRGIKSGLSN